MKKFAKPILILMSIFSFLFGSNKPQNNAVTILDKTAFKTAINAQNIQLIDVKKSYFLIRKILQELINLYVFVSTD